MGEIGRSQDALAQAGYALPAEWEPHRRTWMCWPCRMEAWGSAAQMERARVATAEVARTIAQFEPVVMVARPADSDIAVRACGGLADIFVAPIDDSWARDTGPTFLSGEGLAGVVWRFNAWGGKYDGYENDKALAPRILNRAGGRAFPAPLVCEGGAIHADGEGTLITTEQCLLNANRNPDRSREAITAILCRYTGVQSVLWLPGEFADVETDGHVDNIACFAAPGRIILGIPPARHPDFAAVVGVKQFLGRARDAEGRAFEIVEMAQPEHAREDWRGRPRAASYVNFYLCNGGLVMPAFDDPADLPALRVLKDCFPGREVVQISARDFVEGGGGIHCITQQEPL
ncbi:MAG TPA: agmatine deiminase family protein [Rhizomicrobium sp.]|jgi:agmatine deiminase|nr:agmatine deiminase family protein [Rhizomicrobium sp.]